MDNDEPIYYDYHTKEKRWLPAIIIFIVAVI